MLIILALVALLARAQTFNNPVVGFDEQFYLLVGDRMWHGAVPYVDIFDRKPIGLFLIYAAVRGLGGDGFLQYKLVALAWVVLTALLIYRAALRIGNRFGAGSAACVYILWLNFMEGEGGQAEVFVALPMVAAAFLTWRAVAGDALAGRLGCAAMLLVGVALQIKYTAVFEGVFFGCALLWTLVSAGRSAPVVISWGFLWIGCALIPTTLAALYYWHIGGLLGFVFANFLSMMGKHTPIQLDGLALIVAIIVPLLLMALPAFRNRKVPFLMLWTIVAVAGVLIFGAFGSPHYGIPAVAPLAVASAPFFGRERRRLIRVLSVLVVFAVVGQIALGASRYNKGGRTEALLVAAAAKPVLGCIYVYDGYPALYMLTGSCLPTRWVFPGHLNMQDEGSARALGIDPAQEVARILATRPEVIVDDQPTYAGVNRVTHGLVLAALARDYRLAARVRTGAARYRLVYRLK